MKKLFSLSFVFLAFASQASVSAQSLPENSISPDQLVENFCTEAEESKVKDDQEIAEMVSAYIAELDNPEIEQIIALSQIAVKLESGQKLESICK